MEQMNDILVIAICLMVLVTIAVVCIFIDYQDYKHTKWMREFVDKELGNNE